MVEILFYDVRQGPASLSEEEMVQRKRDTGRIWYGFIRKAVMKDVT